MNVAILVGSADEFFQWCVEAKATAVRSVELRAEGPFGVAYGVTEEHQLTGREFNEVRRYGSFNNQALFNLALTRLR